MEFFDANSNLDGFGVQAIMNPAPEYGSASPAGVIGMGVAAAASPDAPLLMYTGGSKDTTTRKNYGEYSYKALGAGNKENPKKCVKTGFTDKFKNFVVMSDKAAWVAVGKMAVKAQRHKGNLSCTLLMPSMPITFCCMGIVCAMGEYFN